jgi:predicted DNA-binding protein
VAIPEQDYLIPFSCRLPISLHQKLDELKRERGLDKTEVVKAALAAHMKKLGIE